MDEEKDLAQRKKEAAERARQLARERLAAKQAAEQAKSAADHGDTSTGELKTPSDLSTDSVTEGSDAAQPSSAEELAAAKKRAAEEARSRGVADRIEFVQLDLSDSLPDGTFDLVSAQFLHSMVRLDRPKILTNAAAAVRPGGLLLIVDHGSAPPWASPRSRAASRT